MAKIILVGKAGKNVCISEDGSSKGEWYGLTAVKSQFDSGEVKPGDEVAFKSEFKDGGKVLLYIKKVEGGATSTGSAAKSSSGGGYGGRTPADNESIKRQAIAHATSRTMIALQGMVTVDTVEPLMEKIYKKYQELVG